ncbi:MAG: Lrp/AsnC ligand binding domain-containing protein [Muribaculaceae bacterium]|nr:Lrp/AsnC ligand binding domain-containing protein [Muribaculaceae bacterium]
MPHLQFDTLDRNILHLLAENARKPFLEIARECGVSGAAVHQRIQKLTASGVIKGFESLISPAAVGYDTCAYVGCLLAGSTDVEQVVARLKEVPEVVECHCTTGKYDLMLKIYARNNEHLLRIISSRVQRIVPGRTETLISFREEFKRQAPILEENF